jgi:hypothetical protein
VSLKKEKYQGNAEEETVINKEENSLTLNTFVWIRPRIRPLASLHASTQFFIRDSCVFEKDDGIHMQEEKYFILSLSLHAHMALGTIR